MTTTSSKICDACFNSYGLLGGTKFILTSSQEWEVEGEKEARREASKRPSGHILATWLADGVELDGSCPHGKASRLIELGMI